MRRRALAAGLLVVAAYAAGSFASARLGTIGPPLLDGLAPPPPYRWVNPPDELAADNKDPFSGKFPVAITNNGSDSAAFSTRDGQLTIVLSQGAIPTSPGQRSALVEVTPLDPATLGDPPSDLEVAGNAYQVTATYRPGGEEVSGLAGGGDQRIVLVYPAVAGGTHQSRTVIQSSDGERWHALPSQDAGAQQQVQAAVESLGYFAVAAPPEQTGVSTPALGIVILAAVLVILGALVIRRSIRRDPSAPSSRRRP